MAKTYIKNFGVVSNLVIRSSRGTPVSYFTLTGDGGKFARDVAVFGEEKAEMMKKIGNGGRAWVRGELVERSREGGISNGCYLVAPEGFFREEQADTPL
jgi:hypothetical protein